MTETFRFYDGPIDNPETGLEGLMNSWPMDEAFVDHVEGGSGTGIINDAVRYPTINAALVFSLDVTGGEANISNGWHAIEFPAEARTSV